MTGTTPSSSRARTSSAIRAQFSAVATLRPPNFITTHGESGYGVSTLCSATLPCTVMTIVERAPYLGERQTPDPAKRRRKMVSDTFFPKNGVRHLFPDTSFECRSRPLQRLDRRRIRDRAPGRRAHEPGVLREQPPLRLDRRRGPLRETLLEHLRRKVDVDRLLLGVDHDAVAVLEHGDRPADCRLGRHVPDDEPVAAAREPPVRDQRDLVAETSADDGAGRA